MKLLRSNRHLLAWTLYFSVLLAALACSVGHGQMAGMQLSGLDGQYCSLGIETQPSASLSARIADSLLMVNDSGCAINSLFNAQLVAALFGLLGLMALLPVAPLPFVRGAIHAPRYFWPAANPRASP